MVEREDMTTYVLSGLGLTISLADFRNWLDIILIVLSIINVLIIIFVKLHRYLKDKKLTSDEKEDLLSEISTLKREIEKLNSKKDGDISE